MFIIMLSFFFVKPILKLDYKVGILIKNIPARKYCQVSLEIFPLYQLYIDFVIYLTAFFQLFYFKISLKILFVDLNV